MNTNESIVESIQVMLHQEVTCYATSDFLASAALRERASSIEIDSDCRSKMVAWCYQVVDFCSFNRESVAIAMNFLDRVLATPTGRPILQDRAVFQLAAMTALYTSIKLNEPEAIDPQTVSDLSKGAYTAKEVEDMERHMLNALQWRVNPPTALDFVRQFLSLIPESSKHFSPLVRTSIYDVAKFQTELAVSEYDFITIRPSVVAFCAIVNAVEAINLDEKVLNNLSFLSVYESLFNTNNTTEEAVLLRNVRTCLFGAVVQSEAVATARATATPTTTSCSKMETCESSCSSRRDSFQVSPRTAVLQ